MLLSYHNLFFMRQLVLNARRAIVRGDFLAYKKDFLSLYDGGVDDAL
jgi:queuine/archaeosine tRNA-ribosyltransferase